jgi:hypothetical protein
LKKMLLLLALLLSTSLASSETRPRQQVGVTLQSQPIIYERAPCDAQYAIELKDIDDVARVYIDDQLLFVSHWAATGIKPGMIRGKGHKPGDSGGLVDLTPYLQPGATHIKIELYNAPGCCSTALEVEVFRDETSIYHRKIRMADGAQGIKFSQVIAIDRQCTGQREANPKTAGGNS